MSLNPFKAFSLKDKHDEQEVELTARQLEEEKVKSSKKTKPNKLKDKD